MQSSLILQKVVRIAVKVVTVEEKKSLLIPHCYMLINSDFSTIKITFFYENVETEDFFKYAAISSMTLKNIPVKKL